MGREIKDQGYGSTECDAPRGDTEVRMKVYDRQD